MWLKASDVGKIREMLSNAPLSEEQIREITSMQLRNVLDDVDEIDRPSSLPSRRTLVVIIPILVLVGAGLFLLSTCYPRAVFLWGDGIERYERIKQRRTFVWGVIIVATLVSVVANFLSSELLSWWSSA